jgi:hypothetical protein
LLVQDLGSLVNECFVSSVPAALAMTDLEHESLDVLCGVLVTSHIMEDLVEN